MSCLFSGVQTPGAFHSSSQRSSIELAFQTNFQINSFFLLYISFFLYRKTSHPTQGSNPLCSLALSTVEADCYVENKKNTILFPEKFHKSESKQFRLDE